MSISHNDALRDALCAQVIAQIDVGTAYASGRLVVFDSNGVVIATHSFAKPAFQTPVAGLALANPLTQDPAPIAGATPVRFEAQDCNGLWVWRGSVGPTGDLTDFGTPIPAGLPTAVQGMYYRAPF